MHDPLRVGVIRPVPEDPWWWPLGPTGFVVAMFGGVLWFSSTWPMPDPILATVQAIMQGVLGLLLLGWLALGVWLYRRRQSRIHDPMWVVVDAAGLTLDGEQLAWQQVDALEWSPFGLVYEREGKRTHFQARITDDQVARLEEATARFSR